MTNEAAWIKQKQAQLEVDVTEKYEPSTDELLIKFDVDCVQPDRGKTPKVSFYTEEYLRAAALPSNMQLQQVTK
jgi:hypothetical protein